jgi:hypothetical protein
MLKKVLRLSCHPGRINGYIHDISHCDHLKTRKATKKRIAITGGRPFSPFPGSGLNFEPEARREKILGLTSVEAVPNRLDAALL